MLKRIYADNYKSLVNFEIRLDSVNLLLGANGSGKTSVFEVLHAIQRFVCNGEKIGDILHSRTLTRWQKLNCQTFELEAEFDNARYKYALSIEHYENSRRTEIVYERLYCNDKPIIRMEKEDGICQVHLYRDDYSEITVYPAASFLSGAGAVPSRKDNMALTRFKECLWHILIVQAIPTMMNAESQDEAKQPSLYMENFLSWYRFISQDQGMAFRLMSELKQVLPGFDYFRFEAVGEKHRRLKAFFTDGQISSSYDFAELSDGQKMVIVLYTLLYFALSVQNSRCILCLDEPENFLALPEIQPWLTALYDNCTEGKMQAILISHHPECINYLTASPPAGLWFERESSRPVRVKKISMDADKEGIPVSGLNTRWI